MPLLDHFHDPVKRRLGWTSLHSGWATYIASSLMDHWLQPPFVAAENTQRSMAVEIDIGTFDAPGSGGTAVATATRPRGWTAARPRASVEIEFGGAYEVLVYADEAGWRLVGAIELVSEKNKDRPATRTAFVGKCAGLLQQGVSVVVVDIVTSRLANLHNLLLEELEVGGPALLPRESAIYASAYHPVRREEKSELDIWAEELRLGQPLPTMPLRLDADLVVPVELEATYTEICRRRRVI